MKYFDHDTDATKDELIQALRLECGGAAVDVYWAVLECIYREESDWVPSRYQAGTKSVLHWLCIDWETFKAFILKMHEIGLFVVEELDDDALSIHSERASENIAKYQARAETARQNGKKNNGKAKRKRTGTKSVPSGYPAGSKSVPSRGEKEKEKVLDIYTDIQIPSASAEAAAAKAAPPSAPICPLCSSPLKSSVGADGIKWHCKLCGDVKEPAYGIPAKEAS